MRKASICPLSGEEKKRIRLTKCNSCCWCHPSARYGIMGCELLQRKNKNQRNWKLDVRRVDESELYNIPADVQLPLLPLELKEAKEKISEVLGTVTNRERTVLVLMFGLEENEQLSMGKIACQLNTSQQRIQQIAAKALRKLRHPSRIQKLEGFFGLEPSWK